jgi:hypothetical protein
MDKISKSFLIGFGGVISAIVTNFLLIRIEDGLFYIPGIVFGLVFVLIAAILFKSPVKDLMVWLVISIFSYFIAYQAAFWSSLILRDLGVVVGGLVGSFLITFGFRRITVKIPAKLWTTITGGLLATIGLYFAFPIITSSVVGPHLDVEELVPIFLIWQIGMVLYLVHFMLYTKEDAAADTIFIPSK